MKGDFRNCAEIRRRKDVENNTLSSSIDERMIKLGALHVE